jgi:hypothetical protein
MKHLLLLMRDGTDATAVVGTLFVSNFRIFFVEDAKNVSYYIIWKGGGILI